MEVLDATSEPDGDLVKEVHAYFGLCLYLVQVFETGLINILTSIKASSKPRDSLEMYRQMFDALYAQHEKMTFGNLLRALGTYKFLPANLFSRAQELKNDRDYLAHRYFRDRSADFVTTGGCLAMIEELDHLRKKFSDADAEVSDLFDKVYERMGINLTAMAKETMQEMLKEAKAKYASSVKNHRAPDSD